MFLTNRFVCVSLIVLAVCALFSCVSEESSNDTDHPSDDDDDNDDDNNDNNDDDNNDDDDNDDNDTDRPSYPIVNVEVEPYNTYRLANNWFPGYTGDLWPSAWGEDDLLYTANGDGFGFGGVFADIRINVVEGMPPDLTGYAPSRAHSFRVAHIWGPEAWKYSRKPTGMICIDGVLYMFFQNLANVLADEAFGDAPHGSISFSTDLGATWQVDETAPMFTDHVFTTGFFLDYGQCNRWAPDDFVYVFGLDYNWRFADNFDQTKMYLARVPKDRIIERSEWEFFTGTNERGPTWSRQIMHKTPVLTDEELYIHDYSGICQGSVVYIPQINRYIYSTRAVYEWIFWEAKQPWGPWTKIAVIEWTGGWTEDFHPGYPAVIPSKYLDADGLGGWIISSLSDSWFSGRFYCMGFRRFELDVAQPEIR